ncbi:sterol-binding protein [Bacillus sp. V3-13]|uniref:sterol-binding protein n=1 Tax=Bacillus sp. V3-13 TaxID=2053728 RepID=UPI000C78FA00|nr:sterol-binding protein [Bacillus sp. V3-13]PLR79317.1 sterol-binding protein [Bacillus sp. V3-13]
MEQHLTIFIEEIKSRSHTVCLLENISLTILFSSEKTDFCLNIGDGDISMAKENVDTPNAAIEGEEGLICSLLDGELKLREAMANGLSITAPFRIILFLESLFFLGKPYNPAVYGRIPTKETVD